MYPPYIDHCASTMFYLLQYVGPGPQKVIPWHWRWVALEIFGGHGKKPSSASFRKLRTHANVGGDGAIQQELVIDQQRSEIWETKNGHSMHLHT